MECTAFGNSSEFKDTHRRRNLNKHNINFLQRKSVLKGLGLEFSVAERRNFCCLCEKHTDEGKMKMKFPFLYRGCGSHVLPQVHSSNCATPRKKSNETSFLSRSTGMAEVYITKWSLPSLFGLEDSPHVVWLQITGLYHCPKHRLANLSFS